MDTIQNAACQLYIPYNKAIRPHTYREEEAAQPCHHYSAIAISEGVWNDATFTATAIEEMVSAHTADGSITRIRICAEHEDTITSLLGRVTAMRMEEAEDVGTAAVIEFDLFDGTQMQQDIIKQLEQAPDLIGLSICATGNLVPLYDDAGKQNGWEWQKLRLAHVALLTWPGCETTTGSIVAAYKHADGTDFNPAIFTQTPTEYAMEPEPITQTVATPAPETDGDGTKYAAALDLAQAISLSKDLGIEPNTKLLASLSAVQAKEYAAELAKIIEARNVTATTAPQEKGSAYGATNTNDMTLAAVKAILNYGGNA